MTDDRPVLEQFRIEDARDGLIHLVFDAPGRTMNLFSNAAIQELGGFARWLRSAGVRGVLIRSGKDNAFCAGADLAELGVAYDMIMAARPQERFDIAFDHFFRLSQALRTLETAGKPVAVAIEGLALGGGCELALAAHHRVLVDHPKVVLGLPESLVGLLPGAGGTQRLPRLVGVEAALPILLDGVRLAGRQALASGWVDELAEPGEAVAAAERWLLAAPEAAQPWDRAGYFEPVHADIASPLSERRAATMAATQGHYPAPLAILDCLEQGLVQRFDGAIRTEMAIFVQLIQRAESRNMIQTLFLGKQDHDRAAHRDDMPAPVAAAVAALRAAIEALPANEALAMAGFGDRRPPARARIGDGYWIDSPAGADALARIAPVLALARRLAPGLAAEERRMADYAAVSGAGFPAYLGGPFALAGRAVG